MGWGLPKFKPAATYGNDTRKYFADRNPLAERNTIVGKTKAFARDKPKAVAQMAAQQEPFVPEQLSGQLNTGYLDQLRGMAGNQSGWERSQLGLAQSQANQARDALSAQGASGLASAQGNMAMRGGLTSGATERLGSQNLRNQIMGQQQIGQQLSDQSLAISGAADQRQRALLGQLGQAELGAANYQSRIDEFNANQLNSQARNNMLSNAIGQQNLGGDQQGFFSGLFGKVF